MKDVVVDVVKKELNWKERIIISVFTKTFIKVYNISRIYTVNNILK